MKKIIFGFLLTHLLAYSLTHCLYAAVSDSITYYVTVSSPPGQVTGLEAYQSGVPNSVRLSWITPGDDGYTGALPAGSEYRIQYTTDTVNVVWSTANAQVVISTSGISPGVKVSTTVNCQLSTDYYFRIWAKDEIATNWSVQSATVSAFNSPFSFEIIDTNVDDCYFHCMTIDSFNIPHIVYYNVATYDLKYAKWTGTNWDIQTIDSVGTVGWYANVAVDVYGYPHISYYDSTNTCVKYAKWNGISWSTGVVESGGNFSYSTIAINPLQNPMITYYDVTNGDLKFAEWTGTKWSTSVVDSANVTGKYPGMTLDGKGVPHISYVDETNQRIKYARYNGSGWDISSIEDVSTIYSAPTILVDGSGKIHVGYWHKGSLTAKYATSLDGIKWSTSTIDACGNASDAGPLSITLDGNATPHASYWDGVNYDLKYATSTGISEKHVIDSFGNQGYGNCIAIDKNGDVCIAYRDDVNKVLKYAKWTGAKLPVPMGGNARGKVQAPTYFHASAVYITSVSWQWTNNSTNALGYRVYSSSAGNNFTLAVDTLTLVGNTPTLPWTQTGLIPNTSYQNYTAAVNNGGVVTSSSTRVWTLANPPVSSAFTNVFVTSLTVNAAFNNNPVYTNAEIARSTNNLDWSVIVTLPFSSFPWTDATGLKENTTYYYKLRAKNEAGIYTVYDITISTRTKSQPPTITDNQAGDNVVRNAPGTTYNVDFFDNESGLDTVQYKVSSAPAQGGTVIKDWTTIATLSGTTYYQTDWQVDFTSLLSLPTSNYISVRAWDVAGNTTTLSDVFYVMKDTVPPTSAVTSPLNNTNIQTLTTISGTSNDNYGLNKIEIRIKRLSDNQYWTGSNWSASESWVLTTNVNPWTYNGLTDANLTVGTSYWVVSRAADTAGNVETPGAGVTFTYKTKKTIASGNWTDTASWSGGQMPLDGEAAIINSGHTASLTAGTSALYSLTIESGGNLDLSSGYMVNITSLNGGGFYNYGSISNVFGTCYFSEQKVLLSTNSVQQIGASVFFNSGSTVTLQSNVTFGYVGINSGGKLDAGSQQISVNGNWQQDGTFIAGNSTVTFISSNNQNIGGTSALVFGNFTVNSSSTVSPAKPLDINGNFTISGGTFVAGAFNHTVAGDFKQTGGGFAAQTSTITFDGSAAQTVSVLAGTSFYCLQHTNSGTLTPLSNLDINGDFTHGGTGSFNFGNYTYNFAGKVSILSGASFGGSSTWIFDGTTQQTYPTSGGDIVIVKNPAGLKFPSSPESDIRSLNIDPGCSVDATGINVNLRESFNSSGTFVNIGSTVTFAAYTGNGSIWTVTGSTFNNISVNRPAGYSVSALTNLNIGGWLKINQGILNMAKSTSTVSGTTTIDGSSAKLDLGSSTTTLVGQVDIKNGGTLLLPNANPAPILKLGANYLTVDTGGFFISQSSNNLITSTNPGSVFYTFKCYASTVNVTGVTLESAGYDIDVLFISSDTKINNLNNVIYKNLSAVNRALSLSYSIIPGTFTFAGHSFDTSVSTNVSAPYLTSGIVVMQDATGNRAGALYEVDPNDRVFWQPGDSFTLTQPAGGETYAVGTSTTIKWNTFGSVKNVKLEYSKDDFVSNINFIANVSTSASFGSFNWTIPDDSSPTVKVRVSALNYPTINAISNTFTIQPPVAAPGGLKAALLGTTSIQWQFIDNADNETGLYISSGTSIVYRLSSNLGPLTGTGLTTSWWEIGLSTNTRYTRYSEAVNAGGSAWSAAIASYTAANPPTGSSVVSVSSAVISLSWSANSNPSYTRWGILRSTDNFATTNTITDFGTNYTTTSYTDTAGLNPATTYWYKVQAFNEDGLASVFDLAITTVTLSAPVTTPSAPTGLTATEVTSSSIKWLWKDNATNEDGYRVKTATDGVVADLSANTIAYQHINLSPNTLYSIYVEAYNIAGSSKSEVVSRYTLANIPTNFVSTAKDYNWIALSWSANNNPSGTQYELQSSTASDFSIYTSSLTYSLTHLLTDLTQLTTYYYRLYAINGERIKVGPVALTVQTLNSATKGSIAGKVTQANGTAITGVLVQLYNNNGTAKISETFTTPDGNYAFENLDDGIYRVVCSWLVNEIESVVYKTDIPENSKDVIFTLEIQYQLAQLAGKITLGSRANFAGKFAPSQQPYIQLIQRGKVIAKINTDSQGNYSIPNLLPNRYVVRAFNGVQLSEPTEIQVKEGEKLNINFRFALGLDNNEVYAYPNPCQNSVTIRYKVNTNHTVTLRIYNIAGELVKIIKGDGTDFYRISPKNDYAIPWNLKNEDDSKVASGVYIYILELKETADDGEKKSVTKKLAIIK